MSNKTGHWYCHHCEKEVNSVCVTFEENHQLCGNPVEWVEDKLSPDLEAEADWRELYKEKFGDYPEYGDKETGCIYEQGFSDGVGSAARRYATTVEAKEREIADLKDTADGIEKDLRALKQENERLNTLIAHYELSEANYKKTLHIQRQLIEQSKDCFKKVKELEDENARLQKLVAQKIE